MIHPVFPPVLDLTIRFRHSAFDSRVTELSSQQMRDWREHVAAVVGYSDWFNMYVRHLVFAVVVQRKAVDQYSADAS